MFPYVGNTIVTKSYLGLQEVSLYGGTLAAITGPTVFVSPNGSDLNNGSTRLLPVRTLSRAAELSAPGTTVALMAGVYYGAESFWASGTVGNPIIIRPDANAYVVFDGTGGPANTTVIDIGGSYVHFVGCTVRNSNRAGIQSWETTGVRIIGNKVHTCFKNGIWVGGGTPTVSHDNVIEYNEVFDCVRENIGQAMGAGGWSIGIAIANSDATIAQFNYVHHVYGEGIGILESIGAQINDNIVHDAFSVNIYLDNAQDAICKRNLSYNTANAAYYRTSPAQGAAYGIIIVNEVTSRVLPSSGLTVTDNIVCASALIVSYSTFGSNTGLVSSIITPNTYYATYEAYRAAIRNG